MPILVTWPLPAKCYHLDIIQQCDGQTDGRLSYS